MCPSTSYAQVVVGAFMADASQLVSGGNSKGFTLRGLGLLAVEYQLDESLVLHVDAQIQRGKNGSDASGDIQAYSNIDEADFSRFFEVWVQKEFDDIGLRLKVGQVDANSEFAYVSHSNEFINSSMGVSPTVFALPTYPLPRLSVNAFLQTTPNTIWSAGVYADEENTLNSVFSIAQWRKRFTLATLSLGVWHKSSGVSRLSSNNSFRSGKGYYATVSGNLAFTMFDSSNAGWFSQVGVTEQDISPIDLHISLGTQWYGVHGRANSVAGIALTYVSTSNRLHKELPNSEMDLPVLARSETALEVFYRHQINEHFALKPDLQYIISPASANNIDNALVFTVRTELTF